MAKRRRPEQELHKAVANLLWIYENQGLLIWWPTPNGLTAKNARLVRIFKDTGQLRPGIPDIFVMLPPFSGIISRLVGIELKVDDNQMTETQDTWAQRFGRFGVPVYVVRTLDDLQKVVLQEMNPLSKAMA